MPPKSKEFEAEKAKWYKKLKKEGFEDIEQDEHKLKMWHSYYFRLRHDATKVESKTEYYRLAGQFLYDHEFKSRRDELIWMYHSQGTGIDDIVKLLKSRGFKNYTFRNAVHETIQELTKIMVKRARER